MNSQDVIKVLREALSYYAAGNHIQCDALGVATQPYIEPGHRAKDALDAADEFVKSNNDGISKVFMICDSYESGFGHGLQKDGLDLSKTPHSDMECGEAYQLGYDAGFICS